ncbi:hypothetical protein [Streptomyces sp. RKAG293]|uniref:hypothetical protein n=1 Tax=Streptomyces sp. RKAG293 TaxID=2893403 RepID=UPI0020342B91|nr:hypothetical protein [Streptomyces sp. RKAG293]MCM2424220.1 hypothetical protein [Streptomyces sp. RKAG293]
MPSNLEERVDRQDERIAAALSITASLTADVTEMRRTQREHTQMLRAIMQHLGVEDPTSQ